MNPASPPPSDRPSPPRLGVVAWLLGALAVLVAAAFGYGLAHALASVLPSSAGAPHIPWVAAAAAALSVVLTGGPLGWLLWKRAADMAPGAGRADAGHAPPAGMPHALFMHLAEREFARARRYGTGAALVLVDIDRYTRLCQARGVAAGQAVRAELLRRTAPTLRTADALTCFGESQIAVFLVHADVTGALDVAERIRERSEQMEVQVLTAPPGLGLRITVSAGVAHLRPAHLSLQALLDDALDALTAARTAGGNCVRAAPVDASPPDAPGGGRERRAKTRPQPPGPTNGG